MPDDDAVKGGQLVPYQVDPWRAPAAGGGRFVLSGANFPTHGCSVSFGGVPAVLDSVTSGRMYGTLPTLEASEKPYDVQVVCGEVTKTLVGHYYALGKPFGVA